MLRQRQDIDEFIADIQRTKRTRRTSARVSDKKKTVIISGGSGVDGGGLKYLDGSSDLVSATQMQRSSAPPPTPKKREPEPRSREQQVHPRSLSLAFDHAEEQASLIIPSPPPIVVQKAAPPQAAGAEETGLLLFIFKQARKTDKTFEEVLACFDQLSAEKKRKIASLEKKIFEE